MASRMRTAASFGVGLEGGLDALAVFQRHAAVDGEEAVLAGEPLRGQQVVQPLLRGAVFGENDDAAVGPFAVGLQSVLQPLDQRVAPCCRRVPRRASRSRRSSASNAFPLLPSGVA